MVIVSSYLRSGLDTKSNVSLITPARSCLFALLLTVPLWFLNAQPASALCCACTSTESANTTICITSSKTSCPTLPADSQNPQVKKLTCTIEVTNCQSVAKGGACVQGPVAENLYQVSTSAPTNETTATPPNLNVPIPGLSFAQNVVTRNGYFEIPYFAQYIAAAYRYLISISAIVAAIMIVYGGFLYILGGTGASIEKGKTVITDAVIGLVLILGAYTILATVNPDTLALEALRLKVVEPMFDDIEVIPTNYRPPPPPAAPSGQSPPENIAPNPYKFSSTGPAVSTGPFALPPTPGSKGWIENGNCSFELNQAGVPTILSTYKCALEVVAKEQGINGCYMITALGKETYLGLTNIIGHDENPTQKITIAGAVNYFPERKKFLSSGQSYLATKGKGGFTFTSLTENADIVENRPNDDIVDLTKEDLGLDPRFSHGFGIGLTKIPFGCPIDRDIRKWIQPYFALKGGAQWTRCTLDHLGALDFQTYNGTVYNHYLRWGGCYGPTGLPAPCVDLPKDFNKALPVQKGSYEKRGGYVDLTVQCLKAKDPYTTIYKGHFSICRGDLPLDRQACETYVETYLKDLNVPPKSACSAKCFDKRMPVICVPNSNCEQLQINPAFLFK